MFYDQHGRCMCMYTCMCTHVNIWEENKKSKKNKNTDIVTEVF